MPQVIDVPGHGHVEFPDGMSDSDIVSAIKKINTPPLRTSADLQQQGAQIAQAGTDSSTSPTAGIPAAQRFAEGYGSAMPRALSGIEQFGLDSAKGVNSILAGGKPLFDQTPRLDATSNALQQSIDEHARLDKPLMETPAGGLGNAAGTAAAYAPMSFIPGANTYKGAGMMGAATGATMPVETGGSRALDTGLGAAAGLGGQFLGKMAGNAIQPVQSSLSPEEQALAKAAAREQIPLTAGQETGSRVLKTAESVLQDLPFTSTSQRGIADAQQRAFTAAALRRAGMTGDSAQGPALLAQKQNLGGTLGDISQRNKLDFNQGLTNKLADIVDNANSHLPPDEAKRVAGIVDKVLEQVGPSGHMEGTNYAGWREPLRAMGQAGDATSRYMSQVRSAMDNAFRDQLQGTEAALHTDTSRKYANLKTVMQAMGGAGQLPAKGQIAPSQLSSAVTNAVGKEGRATGAGDLNELARIGTTFMKDIPNSGTSPRTFLTNVLTGNLPGMTAGAGLGYAEGKSPEAALAGGAAGMATTAALPKLAQALMNSKGGQQYLKEELMKLTPAARDMIANVLRSGTIGTQQTLQGLVQ